MTREVLRYGTDGASIVERGGVGVVEIAQFSICDDCGEAYPDPPYYTFPTEACSESMGDLIPKPHKGCTGNLCPTCAYDLMPDDIDDPRVTKDHLRAIGAL